MHFSLLALCCWVLLVSSLIHTKVLEPQSISSYTSSPYSPTSPVLQSGSGRRMQAVPKRLILHFWKSVCWIISKHQPPQQPSHIVWSWSQTRPLPPKYCPWVKSQNIIENMEDYVFNINSWMCFLVWSL